jgi:anti-sigma factor RsiW
MNCEQIREVLNAFVNGRMSGDESRAVRLHLASCAACASRLSPAERVEILPALDDEIEPSEDLAARFHGKLQQRKMETSYTKERSGGLSFLWRRPWQIAAVGTLAALLMAGIFLRHSGDGLNVPDPMNDFSIAENLSLLQDMPVINNLDFLENFETIEKITMTLEGSKEQRSNP